MPDRITLANFVGGLGDLLGIGFMAKMSSGDESPDWRWIVGVASGIIGILLVVVGFLISAGLNNNQATLAKIDARQIEVIKNQGDMKNEFMANLAAIKGEVTRIDQKVNDHIVTTDMMLRNGGGKR